MMLMSTSGRKMNPHKRNLIVLLLIQLVITITHVFLTKPNGVDIELTWHFILGLVFGIFIIIYAFSLRCPNPSCKKLQIFRGLSIFDIRWPEDNCYHCSTQILMSTSGRNINDDKIDPKQTH